MALSLCRYKLYNVLGNEILRALRPSDTKDEAAHFLQVLDRDLPEAFCCYCCMKIHILACTHADRINAQEKFNRVSKSRCSGSDGSSNHKSTGHFHAEFGFEHLQVAMKLHRRGLFADAMVYLGCLTLRKPILRDMTRSPCNLGFYFFEPRILHDRTVVRDQSWILILKE